MSLSLDTPSVAAVIALYFVALAVVTGYLHVNGSAEKRATGPWFYANLLLLLSMLCYLVRLTTDVAPVPLLVVTNGLLLLGYVLNVVGMARLLEVPYRLVPSTVVVAVTCALLVVFATWWNDLLARSSTFAVGMLILQGFALRMYWKARRHVLASKLLPSLWFHLFFVVLFAIWAMRPLWDSPNADVHTLGGAPIAIFALLLNFGVFGLQMGELLFLNRWMTLREASRTNLNRLLLDTMPDLVWMKDTGGTYRVANRAFLKTFAPSDGELIGRTDFDLMDNEGARKLRRDDAEVLRQATVLRFIDTVPAADGRTMSFDTIKAPVYNSASEAIGVLGLARDLTERLAAEQDLRRSEDRFRSLIEQAPLAVCITRGLRIIYANSKFLAALGLESTQVMGLSLFAFVAVAHRSTLTRYFRRQLESRAPMEIESRGLRRDGTEFPVRVSSSLVQLSDGDAAVSFLADLTEAKQAEEHRAKLQAQLLEAQRIESLGNLAGGVAHDMNNTLTAILSVATATLATQESNGTIQRPLSTIVKAAERGGKMVKSLLGIARKTPLEFLPVDINQMLREEAFLLERVAQGKSQLRLDLEVGLKPVLGDASTLSNAIMNLCINALDAMTEKGSLTLRSRDGGDCVEIQVEDTGVGMSKEVLERASDLYFTTKRPGKGTGLGLALVASTVQAHGGKMTLESELGKGTLVTVRLPFVEGAVVVEAPKVSGLTQAQPLRVLLIDDDELVREALQESLALLGHHVTTAESGEHALSLLTEQASPDVVILDMTMPGLGGVGTLPLLKGKLPLVPVLLSTGQHDQAVTDLAASFPSVHVLPKPYSIEALRSKLQMAVSRGG